MINQNPSGVRQVSPLSALPKGLRELADALRRPALELHLRWSHTSRLGSGRFSARKKRGVRGLRLESANLTHKKGLVMTPFF